MGFNYYAKDYFFTTLNKAIQKNVFLDKFDEKEKQKYKKAVDDFFDKLTEATTTKWNLIKKLSFVKIQYFDKTTNKIFDEPKQDCEEIEMICAEKFFLYMYDCFLAGETISIRQCFDENIDLRSEDFHTISKNLKDYFNSCIYVFWWLDLEQLEEELDDENLQVRDEPTFENLMKKDFKKDYNYLRQYSKERINKALFDNKEV